MANEEHLDQMNKALKYGDIKLWNFWKEDLQVTADLSVAYLSKADLSNANLSGADLSHSNLSQADLNNANLTGANIQGATLSKANLSQAKLSEVNLRNARLRMTDLRNAILSKANLNGANLNGADLSHSALGEADLSGANLSEANLSGAYLGKADLSNVNLSGADLSHSNLSQADLSNVNLSRASLHNAKLPDANLYDARVDSKTLLQDAQVDGCRINRYVLESLKDYGALSKGQMMRKNIEDPVAKLRSYYSGFWQWIHLAALTIFIYPYAFFIIKNYLIAQFNLTGETMTLLQALWKFMLSGGLMNGTIAWLPFGCFCFQLIYNLLRGALLYKTKSLELIQQSTGLPPRFSLRGIWAITLNTANAMFAINLLVVAYHSWHFMQMRVPVITP